MRKKFYIIIKILIVIFLSNALSFSYIDLHDGINVDSAGVFTMDNESKYLESVNTYDDESDYTPYDKSTTTVDFYILTRDTTKWNSSHNVPGRYSWDAINYELTYNSKIYSVPNTNILTDTNGHLENMGAGIIGAKGVVTTANQNKTFFFDEGEYWISDYTNYRALNQENMSMVGLLKDASGESLTIIKKKARASTETHSPNAVEHYRIDKQNIYFENLIFDGQNLDTAKNRIPLSGGGYIQRGDSMFWIIGNLNSDHSSTKGFVMRDLVIRNIGDSYNDVSVWGNPTSNSKRNLAIFLWWNRGQHNFEDIKFKDIKTTLNLSTIHIHTSTDNYFRNIEFFDYPIPASTGEKEPDAYTVKIEHREGDGSLITPDDMNKNIFENITFPETGNNKLRANNIYSQDYRYRTTVLNDFRYVYAHDMSGLRSSYSGIRGLREKDLNPAGIDEIPYRSEIFPGYSVGTYAVYDLRDNYWLIRHKADDIDYVTKALENLKSVYNFAQGKSANSVPELNIKIVADSSTSDILSFKVPDFGADKNVNIVAVEKNTETDMTIVDSNLKKLVPLAENATITLPAINSNKVKLYNFDFHSKAKYTLHESVNGILANPGLSITGKDARVKNSSTNTFVNCRFTVLLKEVSLEKSPIYVCGNFKVTPEIKNGYTHTTITQSLGDKIDSTDINYTYSLIDGDSIASIDQEGNVIVNGEGNISIKIVANDPLNEGEIPDATAQITNINVKRCVLLNFNANGGVNPPVDIITTVGSAVNDPGTYPTRTGYKFKGWAVDNTGSSLYDFSTLLYADKTVYAVWEKLKVNLIFDANGGVNPPAIITKDEGLSANDPGIYPTRTGYKFKGWAADNTGSSLYDFSTLLYADKTVYAVWEKKPSLPKTGYNNSIIYLGSLITIIGLSLLKSNIYKFD